MGLGCAAWVAELRPRDVASVAGRSPFPSRSVRLSIKKVSLHTFGSARPSRSGVLCSALVRELTRGELSGVSAARPARP